ncbi:MAG: HAMP domain-containing sensor histidine kinase [Cocleimonas sp.]
MQQKRLMIILALIVLLPLMLLGWQGWKINQDNKQLNEARFNSLVSARLNQVDTIIQSYFEEMQLKWNLLIPQWDLSNQATRKRIENNGNIRQIFIIDANKIRRFPPTDAEITAAEKTFVNRLASIWQDPQMLFSNQTNIQTGERFASLDQSEKRKAPSKSLFDFSSRSSYQESADSQLQYDSTSVVSSASEAVGFVEKAKPKISTKRKSNSIEAKTNNARQGWYMWHWGSDSNLIYWRQDKSQQIVGIEMEPIRVKADLISRLPDTSSRQANQDDFRLRLLDTAGHVVYQWGNYNQSPNETMQKKAPLSYPLSSWSLEYYGKTYNGSAISQYTLLITLLGFGLLISGLAWFLYREQSREMRQAAQRVQFVSQVSHELKTPLTNIRMYAEMLEDQIDDREQPKRYLQVITDESKRLTRLISNVLNFSRAPRIHLREIDPNNVIQQSIDHFKPGFEAKQIAIESELLSEDNIQTDPDILEQILNNLLSNVEKYASIGKRVTIHSDIKDSQFMLRVRDYGKGVSRSERKRIFQAFYRINDNITEGVSGTGIGLTIAQQQAQNLGGTLEYIEVKQGACFQLLLPIKPEVNMSNYVKKGGVPLSKS